MGYWSNLAQADLFVVLKPASALGAYKFGISDSEKTECFVCFGCSRVVSREDLLRFIKSTREVGRARPAFLVIAVTWQLYNAGPG